MVRPANGTEGYAWMAEAFAIVMARTEQDGDCLIYTGYKNRPEGYGRLRLRRKSMLTHRIVWSTLYGPIPPGMSVMHTCDNPPCVRPAHLRLGTHAANMQDMVAKGRWVNRHVSQTHCLNGHPFDEANTQITLRGHRQCRACRREYERKARAAGRRA